MARRARIGAIRRRVAASGVALFLLVFGVICTTGATGASTTAVATQTTASSGSSAATDDDDTTTGSELADDADSTPRSFDDSPSAGATSAPSAVTTSQS